MKKLCAVMLAAAVVSSSYGEESEISVVVGDATIEMIWIEPGSFMMGTSASQKAYMDSLGAWEGPMSRVSKYIDGELPQHRVTLTQGFYLGRLEVTQRQWTAVMGTKPWSGNPASWIGPDQPARSVSWLEVQEFIRRLNQQVGGGRFRLPTEAEWEYAARAGTEALWWSGDDPTQAVQHMCTGTYTDTGDFRYSCDAGADVAFANPWGLYDMMGNVSEYVLDGYAPYQPDPAVDPVGPNAEEAGGSGLRGGNSGDPVTTDPGRLIWHARPAWRGDWWQVPRDGAFWIGFRLLREAETPTGIEEGPGWGRIKDIQRGKSKGDQD